MREIDPGDALSDSLLGFWPLDENGGQIYRDLSSYRHHAIGGTGLGGTAPPTRRAGRPGITTEIGASSNYVKINKKSPFDNLQLPLTICAWVYPTTVATNKTIFGQYSDYTISGGIGKLLRLDTGTLTYYTTSASAAYQSTSGGPSISANAWTFVAVAVGGTVSAPTWTLMKNGAATTGSFGAALYSSGPVSDDCFVGSTTRSIGISGGGGEVWVGYIAGVRLWRRTLSVQALRRIAADPWAGTRNRPVRVWYLPSTASYTLVAEHGVFNLTGQDVALPVARKLVADHGSFALTGQDVALTASRTMAAEHGTFNLTGQDVSLTHGYRLVAEHGTFTVTGQDVDLTSTGSAPEVPTPTGGDDAPARRADVERLGRLRKRQEQEREDRQRKLRESIEAAYAAALGLPAKPSREDRAPLREAVAEAAAVAPTEIARDVERLEQMAATLRTARHVKRLIQELQALRARLRTEDDAMTVLLLVM